MEQLTMDHNEALQSQACEKYLLGELSSAERDAFEDHYFSCAECAAQLRSAAEFLSASREILAGGSERASEATLKPDYVRPPRGWFPWLNPLVAGPAFAALLLFIAYQNFVTIPRYKQSASPRVLPMHSLITANTLGDDQLTFTVLPDQLFGVYVDAPYDPAYSTYLLTLLSPSGTTTPLRSLNAAEAQKTQIIAINPGRQAGKYAIVVSGLASPSADPSSARELARLQFSVALAN
jgi:Putative zinc-finger